MSSSSRETEIKLRVASAEEARARLTRLGAALATERHLEDNVLYDDAAGSWRLGGRVLRLRRAAGTAVVTYKGPGTIADDVKSREELEVVVSSAEVCERIFSGLGLLKRFRYQKYRAVYRLEGALVFVDETPVGTFLEVEGSAAGIHDAAAALGFSREDYVFESYPVLFLASGAKGDMLIEPQR